jgi:hypothetical protein
MGIERNHPLAARWASKRIVLKRWRSGMSANTQPAFATIRGAI